MTAPHEPRRATDLPLDNRRIADRLAAAARALDEHGDNPFRARAYEAAADLVRHLDRPAHVILEAEGTKGLEKLPGIGPRLARAIETLAHTGHLPLLDQLRGDGPEPLLATVAGIGPGLARRIHEQLGVETLEELERAAADGRLAAVPGMGRKRLRGIREALAGRLGRRGSSSRPAEPPPVEDLLEIDRRFREKAEAGLLRMVAPRRFNPAGEAWMPILRTRWHGRRYRAQYSNMELAHQSGKTRDWVVIFYEDGGGVGQCTVVTATSGPLRGRRVVRGREEECARFYQAAVPQETEPHPA
jgi:DNA polymerase (family X)